MTWEELDMYVEILEGKRGREKQEMAKTRFRIYEATDAGNKWYKIQILIDFGGERQDLVTLVWSPLAGYNPVSLTFVEQGEHAGAVRKEISWRWKTVDDVFVPASVSEVWHPEDPGNIDTYRRIVELNECTLNKPLDRNQFEYVALGLGTGDLIIDEVEQVVYIMRDGTAKRLAAFHEPYRPFQPAQQRMTWLIVANVAAIALIVALLLFRRIRKSVRRGAM